jgi:RAB protein geranylgeranyltransferase component A
MDNDDFYDKLPFTLTEEQTTPEYVIFGTGLQECLLAAYKSKSEQKIGLIIDAEKTYGSSLKTVTLKEFHSLASHKTIERMYAFSP